MALAFTTITDSISSLVIEGVNIRDIDELSEGVTARECPVLYPEPVNFISNFELVRDSTGPGATALQHATYDLTYTFLYAPIGAGRGLFDVYDESIEKVGLILDAIITNDAITGLVDLRPQDTINIGPVADPSGAIFHGCQLVFSVMEFVN
jgi:hypothetical protein